MDQMSNRISNLRAFFAEASKAIEASKRCPGCSFMDNIPKSAFPPINGDRPDRIDYQLCQVRSLISQAAKCKGIDLVGIEDHLVRDGSCQASLKIAQRPTSSQTEISADFYEEVQKMRRQSKENDAAHTQWSLLQLLKFSATEREREGLETLVQFMKMFFQISDEQFDDFYNKYLNGRAIEELRQEWKEMKDPGKPTSSNCKCHVDSGVSTGSKDQSMQQELEQIRQDYATAQETIIGLSAHLQAAREMIQQLYAIVADSAEVESSEQDSMADFLGAVSEYTDWLNGRRKST